MAPRVELTNPDKVLYPVTGTTKSEIFDYYTGIAEVIVPHIAGRAATRMHWPNGVEQSSFSESSCLVGGEELKPTVDLLDTEHK
jgi:DNA primase